MLRRESRTLAQVSANGQFVESKLNAGLCVREATESDRILIGIGPGEPIRLNPLNDRQFSDVAETVVERVPVPAEVVMTLRLHMYGD